MLLEFFKTKEGEEKARGLLQNFSKNGNKNVNVDNFIKLEQNYITYELQGKKYREYFTQKQEDSLFTILDYFEGKITTIN